MQILHILHLSVELCRCAHICQQLSFASAVLSAVVHKKSLFLQSHCLIASLHSLYKSRQLSFSWTTFGRTAESQALSESSV